MICGFKIERIQEKVEEHCPRRLQQRWRSQQVKYLLQLLSQSQPKQRLNEFHLFPKNKSCDKYNWPLNRSLSLLLLGKRRHVYVVWPVSFSRHVRINFDEFLERASSSSSCHLHNLLLLFDQLLQRRNGRYLTGRTGCASVYYELVVHCSVCEWQSAVSFPASTVRRNAKAKHISLVFQGSAPGPQWHTPPQAICGSETFTVETALSNMEINELW